MTAAARSSFNTTAATTLHAVHGRTIKVASTSITAVITSPRLDMGLDPSTFRVDRYTATVRILKTAVPSITTPADWVGVLIELPEAATYRSYRALPDDVKDVVSSGEWRLEVESL